MTAEPGFIGFAEHVLADRAQTPARHHRLLIAKLEDVLEGRTDRLMVQMPPGSAKSTFASVLFPGYFLGRHPGSQIIAAAHTASLAEHFGRQVRRVIVEYGELLGIGLAKDSKAAARFSLQDGGAYFAAGVRGPITGRRADLILVDDPIKTWAEADSLIHRDAVHDWYRAELTARLKPGGRIVLIMTRWHEDDLAGRLMRSGGEWEMLTLPALAEAGDVLGRKPGEALWPEWEDAEAIARRREEVGEQTFAALYQQKPGLQQSKVFKTDMVRIVAAAPACTRTIRAWDLAATLPAPGRDPDYTVGVKIGVTDVRQIVVLDVIRFRGTPADVEREIIAAANADGPGTLIALPRDPGQAGVAQVAFLARGLLGYRIEHSPETGAKEDRARPAATQMGAGNILLLAAPWNSGFMEELRAFPHSRKDDQVDALSRAVNTLATTSGVAARRMNIPYGAR
jgi:predicted phage terminase large subunit-like protein